MPLEIATLAPSFGNIGEIGVSLFPAYDVALPPGSTSALITFGIASGTAANPGAASYMMDHIQLGPLEEVFKDDFEPN
jgi:hypothetical protein